MYIKNRRNSSEFKICSPLQTLRNWIGNRSAICHYSYNLPFSHIRPAAEVKSLRAAHSRYFTCVTERAAKPNYSYLRPTTSAKRLESNVTEHSLKVIRLQPSGFPFNVSKLTWNRPHAGTTFSGPVWVPLQRILNYDWSRHQIGFDQGCHPGH